MRKLTPLQRDDMVLLRKGRIVAKWLGCGYQVVGAGPGVLFASGEHPRYPIDMPAQLVEKLVALQDTTP